MYVVPTKSSTKKQQIKLFLSKRNRQIELLEISQAKWVSFISFVVSVTTRQLAVEF